MVNLLKLSLKQHLCFRPLIGFSLFRLWVYQNYAEETISFRPLMGFSLFQTRKTILYSPERMSLPSPNGVVSSHANYTSSRTHRKMMSVPCRGFVFLSFGHIEATLKTMGFRPLMGFSLFRRFTSLCLISSRIICFRPLMGFSLFRHYRSKRLIQKALLIELRLKLIYHICNQQLYRSNPSKRIEIGHRGKT